MEHVVVELHGYLALSSVANEEHYRIVYGSAVFVSLGHSGFTKVVLPQPETFCWTID